MNIAILSSFPPTPCGIAQYAEQQAQHLEHQGHHVTRIDLHAINQTGWGYPARTQLLWEAFRADKVIIHYQPSLFYSSDTSWPEYLRWIVPLSTVAAVCKKARQSEIVVHEPFQPILLHGTWIQKRTAAKMFRNADTLYFHTAHEMEQFRFPSKAKSLLPPATFYRPRTTLTPTEARHKLGLPDAVIYLCIGFFHPGKGYTEFAQQFNAHAPPGTILYVVTSEREPVYNNALARLKREASPNVVIIDRYVSDEDFDNWIVASDYVVAPYLRGFTSGPIARASLYGKQVIVSDLPGLAEQVGTSGTVYTTNAQLSHILARSVAQ